MSVLKGYIKAKKSKAEQARLATQEFIKVLKKEVKDFDKRLDASWLNASYGDIYLMYDSEDTVFLDEKIDGLTSAYKDIFVNLAIYTDKKSPDGKYKWEKVGIIKMLRITFFSNGIIRDIQIIATPKAISSALRGY